VSDPSSPHPPHPPHLLKPARTDLDDLAAACAAGDRAAFDSLHARFNRGLLALFHRRGSIGPEQAEELVQRTWISAWSALVRGRYDPERAALSTFLYAVANKTWLQHLREKRSASNVPLSLHDEESEDALGLASPSDGPELMETAEQIDAVRAFLRTRTGDGALTEQEREIITAAASGTSDRELAARLALAPSTINDKKQSGWGKVRRFLARTGHRPEISERTTPTRE